MKSENPNFKITIKLTNYIQHKVLTSKETKKKKASLSLSMR